MKMCNDFENFVHGVAARYRNEGYEVLIEPKPRDLPGFLRAHRPDLIARRGSETAVIAIKRFDISEPAGDLAGLAALVNERPGWRFDMVIYNPEKRTEVKTPSITSVRRTIDEAQHLFARNQRLAASLLAWAAFEGAARTAVEAVEHEPSRFMPTDEVVKSLVVHGMLDEAEYGDVSELQEIRNAMAHGGIERSIPKRGFEKLCRLANRLLQTATEELNPA